MAEGLNGEVISGLQQAVPPGSVCVSAPQKAAGTEVVTSSPLRPQIGHARPGPASLFLPVW